MNISKEMLVKERDKIIDVYCYLDNYMGILGMLVKDGYYLIEIVFIKDGVLQVRLGQDYEVQIQVTKEHDPYFD